jgi:hypothetical protein
LAARRIFLERFTLEHHVGTLISAFQATEAKIDQERPSERAGILSKPETSQRR